MFRPGQSQMPCFRIGISIRPLSVLQTLQTIYERYVLPGQGDKMKWTEDEIKLFDIFDNATIAKITGRSEKAVAIKRSGSKRYDPFALTKCAVCGKLFYMPDPGRWAYRRNGKRLKLFCSYHCMRTYDNGQQRKEKVAE